MTGPPPDVTAPLRAGPRAEDGTGASPLAVDVAIVVGSFVLELLAMLARAVGESGTFSITMLGDIPLATYLLLGVSSLALLWRRPHPIAVLATTLAASVVWDLLDLADGPSLAILVSLYGVGRYVTGVRATALALTFAVAVVAVDDLVVEAEEPSVVALSVVLVVVAWYVGRRVEGRRAHLDLLKERAEVLEREQAAEARRAVAEERTRIARELHDVVAHRVSLMTVQAGAAQAVADTDPDRAAEAMAAVEHEGREALGELREILGVLRTDADDRDLGPVRGLADLEALVAETSRAGVPVSLVREGAPADLPAPVGLAAYRIVQEALTNVVKHAGRGASATVQVGEDAGRLTVEVTDDGMGASPLPRSGHGLVGMRERVTRLGGTLDAGPRRGGGFRVVAHLPLDREST